MPAVATDQIPLDVESLIGDGPLTEAEKLLLAASLNEMEARGLSLDGLREDAARGPQTDDELWTAVYELTGYRIPRVAVCTEHGHVAPFTVFADMFFERKLNVLLIGNRGGGKTTLSGFLHGAKSRYKPEYESAISGAVAQQGQRAYAEFKRFIRHLGNEVVDTLMSRTDWANGSLTEVIGGTIRALNGPHPNLAQMDELELSTPEPFEEFKNMAQSDARYRAQQLLTSTRKKSWGLVQSVVQETKEAVDAGGEAPWDVEIFCVFETMRNVPECRKALKRARETRLRKLGRDPRELCDCHKVVKGKWDNGKQRSFESVCQGKAFRSDGFVSLEDVQKRFRQLSRMVWEAQQQCLRPSQEGLVHQWVREQHILRSWFPDPAFGSIYASIDWGGTNPHSILFHQVLRAPVLYNPEDPDDEAGARLFPEGSKIVFDELYEEDGCGFYELAQRFYGRIDEWSDFGYNVWPEFVISDPAGAAPKQDFKKCARDQGLEEPKFKSGGAPRYESVRRHIEYGEDDRLYYVGPMCPGMDTEYVSYHWPEDKPGKNKAEDPVKEDDHSMDADRMFIWWWSREGARAPTEHPGSQPKATPSPAEDRGKFGPPRVEPSESPVGSSRDPQHGYTTTDPDGSTRVREFESPSVIRGGLP